MKIALTLIALSASLSLAACSDKEDANAVDLSPAALNGTKTPPKPKAKEKGAAMTPEEIKAFAGSFEDAMREIPPELREDFQKYMDCEIKANDKRPADQKKAIDAARVIEMTAALKGNKALATCS